jgi:hypothetical protein
MASTHQGGTRAWSRRPHFAPSQQLTAQQLNAIMDDELRRQRLLTSALHGHGVVFGYALAAYRKGEAAGHGEGELKLKDRCIDISCGLIIDRHGRDLYWPGGRLCVGDIVNKQPDRDGWYQLQAHYAERSDPPEACGLCPSDAVQWLEQKVVFTLSPWCPEVNWDCPHIPDDTCVTLRDYVCGRTRSEVGPVRPGGDLEWACREPGPLCETSCGGWKYDRDAGIPIACVWVCNVMLKDAACAPVYGFCPCVPKVCEVRPYVYRTPLLFELARDCHIDLARVASLSWEECLIEGGKAVPWERFAQLFKHEEHGFIVWFTKPIVCRTLHDASIFLTALVQEGDADYWKVRRIPAKIEPLNEHNGLALGVRLYPDEEWVVSEINQRRSTLCHGALIELTIRGQMLRDHCGRMLDARPLPPRPNSKPDDPFYLDPKWSGQGRPGDDFIVAFHVDPRPGHERYGRVEQYPSADEGQPGTSGPYSQSTS